MDLFENLLYKSLSKKDMSFPIYTMGWNLMGSSPKMRSKKKAKVKAEMFDRKNKSTLEHII